MRYWLDADVFIQSNRGPYKFNEVPPFWSFMSGLVEKGVICCPKLVFREVVAGKDELVEWFENRRERGLCVYPSAEVKVCYKQISQYVYSNHKPKDSAEFLRGGDPWLVAHAKAHSETVVTFEVRHKTKTTVKVPNICKEFQVRVINFHQMKTEVGFKIV